MFGKRQSLWLALSCALAGCTAQGPSKIESVQYAQTINQYSLRKPPVRYYEDVEETFSRVKARITKAGLRLCEERGYSNRVCDWNVSLHRSENFNAYAGGTNTVVLFSGVITETYYDEEVAFVLAHEIAHHMADHILKSRAATVVGGLVGAALGSTEAGMSLGRLAFSRQQESEADRIAVAILIQAGYNLRYAQDALIRMTRFSASRAYSQFLASHPSGVERVIQFESLRKAAESGI